MDTLRINYLQLLGDIGFGGQGQHQFLECGVQRVVAQDPAHRLQSGGVEHLDRRHGIGRLRQRGQCATQGQSLAGLPAVERIAVVRQ